MKKQFKTKASLGVLASVLALTAQAPVAYGLDELVVTARKRAENLQDVPLAITAFGADSLKQRTITQLEDIAALTPGLTFEDFSNGGFGVPVIRGATQQDITILEQNVSTFFDGIYIPRAYAIDVGVVNMDRIEVVKGPQSALYGQNAFMGAINYVTQQPNEEFGADVTLTYGSDDRLDVGGSVNIPIVEDKLFLRVAGTRSEFDGSWKNNHPNANAGISPGTDGNLGGYEKDYYMASVLFRPVESWDFSLAYHNFETEGEDGPHFQRTRASDSLNCSATDSGFLPAAVNQLICGDLTSPFGSDISVDPRSYGLQQETEVIRFGTSWDVTDSISINYVYGNISSEVATNGSPAFDQVNGDPFGPDIVVPFNGTPYGDFDYHSHDLRVEFDNGGRVRALLGGFVSDGEDRDSFVNITLDPLDTTPVPTSLYRSLAPLDVTETDVRAIYGSLSFDFTDEVRVTAEARYTEEDKKVTDLAGFSETDSSYFTPRITLEWDVTESTLLYGSIAKGVKAAGINADDTTGFFVPSEKFFDEDENWTYEIGAKNTFWDDRLRLNVAGFYIDWSNLQASSARTLDPNGFFFLPPGAITLNQGDATIYGVEIDGALQVTDSLSTNFGFSYTVPEYDDNLISGSIARAGACDGVVCPADGEIGGNTLARTSKTQANIGAIWEAELPNTDLGYYLQGDVAYQSEQYLTELNVGTIPERTLVNLSAGITHENWSLRLWGKNVFDEEYVANSFVINNPFFASYIGTFGPKRTFGVTLDANF